MKVNTDGNVPLKMWLEDIEDGALEQAKNLTNLPFAFKHVALMPDSHQGYGMPIGGVLATKGVIIPNAVGVDIGCGMCAVKTNLTKISQEELRATMGLIRANIPLGFNKHKNSQGVLNMPSHSESLDEYEVVWSEKDNAQKSLGTLGGGNHFIEIQKGSDGYIWIMIHSGSRNLGFKVAEHYNKIAIALNNKYHSVVNEKQELAFLPLETEEAKDYIREMNYCVDFALANRKLMMNRVVDAFRVVFSDNNSWEDIDFKEMINIAHNYARIENHFGENVMVHRKGATSAKEGEVGIIPGSQGAKSYIVKGKGNKESFMSCSHGAGRKMGRKQAQRDLNLEDEIKQLNDKGVVHSIRNIKDLDEAPSAYKDIDVVMENQKDLTEIIVELTPLAVIKG